MKNSNQRNGINQQSNTSLPKSSSTGRISKLPNGDASIASTQKDSSGGSSRDGLNSLHGLSWNGTYHGISQSVLVDLRNDFAADGDIRHNVVRLEVSFVFDSTRTCFRFDK